MFCQCLGAHRKEGLVPEVRTCTRGHIELYSSHLLLVSIFSVPTLLPPDKLGHLQNVDGCVREKSRDESNHANASGQFSYYFSTHGMFLRSGFSAVFSAVPFELRTAPFKNASIQFNSTTNHVILTITVEYRFT